MDAASEATYGLFRAGVAEESADNDFARSAPMAE